MDPSYKSVGLSVCVLMLFCGMAVRGNSQVENANTAPTFRASSHLVLLDVVVTDKSGKPTPALQASDFQVKEDGKLQNIAFLTPPNQTSINHVEPLPSGVYSNAPAYRMPAGTPTVVVLDAVNTSYRDQLYARRQMLNWLKSQYKPGQRAAIFTLTERLSLVQDFTGDPEILRASLEKVAVTEPAFSKAVPATETPIEGLRVNSQEFEHLVAAFQRFQRSQMEYVAHRRAEVTLDAMRRLTRILGGIPGRKNVIWLAGGFPFTLNPDALYDSGELSRMFQRPVQLQSGAESGEVLNPSQNSLYADQIREIAAQMATAQVAVYPVDVRGLVISETQANGDVEETMREIARQTGGRAFINRNDLDMGFVLAQRDAAATYTIGYYPANKKWDRKFRTIDLKTNPSGLETTYRHGYFAVEDVPLSEKKLDQVLTDSWGDDAPDTLVTFEAKVSPSDSGKTRVDFLVDANSLSAIEETGNRKFDVGFYVAALSPQGKVLQVKSTKLDRVFPMDVYNKLRNEGMRLHLDIDVPPSASEIRLAVRDNRTAYIGTVRAPIPTK